MAFVYGENNRQYVLSEVRDGVAVPIRAPQDQLGLAIQLDTGSLVKHGDPETVAAWATKERTKLRAAGLNEWADALVVVSGRFPLEEVNKCLSNTTYAGDFYRRLAAGEIAEYPLFPETAGEADRPRVSG